MAVADMNNVDDILATAILAEYDRQRAAPPAGSISAAILAKAKGISIGQATKWLTAQDFDTGIFYHNGKKHRFFWPKTTKPAAPQ